MLAWSSNWVPAGISDDRRVRRRAADRRRTARDGDWRQPGRARAPDWSPSPADAADRRTHPRHARPGRCEPRPDPPPYSQRAMQHPLDQSTPLRGGSWRTPIDWHAKGFPALDAPIAAGRGRAAGLEPVRRPVPAAHDGAPPGRPRPQHRAHRRLLRGQGVSPGAPRQDHDGARHLRAAAGGGRVGDDPGHALAGARGGHGGRAAHPHRQRGDRPGGHRLDRVHPRWRRAGGVSAGSIRWPAWSCSTRDSAATSGDSRCCSRSGSRAGAAASGRCRRGAGRGPSAVGQSASLRLAGVTCFEGSSTGPRSRERDEAVRALIGLAREVAVAIEDRSSRPMAAPRSCSPGVAASTWTSWSRRWSRRSAPACRCTVVLRSGGTVSHDHGGYDLVSPFGSVRAGGGAAAPIRRWRSGHRCCRCPSRDAPSRVPASVTCPTTARCPSCCAVRDDGRMRAVSTRTSGIGVVRLNDQHA